MCVFVGVRARENYLRWGMDSVFRSAAAKQQPGTEQHSDVSCQAVRPGTADEREHHGTRAHQNRATLHAFTYFAKREAYTRTIPLYPRPSLPL